MKEFLMPSLGADMEDGTLVEWRKKPGDPVSRGDIIAEVDTQKGLIEIEVFEDGYIGKLLIDQGEKVPIGTPMALITTDKAEALKEEPATTQKIASASERPAEPEKKTPQQPSEEHYPKKEISDKPHEKRIKASPLARRIAEENKIDLSTLSGTGENGAITKDDVNKAISERSAFKAEEKPSEKLPEKKTETAAAAGETIRMAVAAAMSKSNREIPHYYLEKKIDMSKALSWLKETNKQRSVQERLLPATLLIKAVAKALDQVPQLNATWENGLQIKNEINVGFVVSLKSGGVMVPTISNADLKDLSQIMQALNDLIPRARAMKLRSSELSSSTITLSSLGEGGADAVYGVIYPPQVAVIGFGGIREEAWVENNMLGIRPVITATLAGDHRANDGLTGSRFLENLNTHLQNPETL